MLKIVVPPVEEYDEKENKFIYGEPVTITLEHSLVSISKWEAKWHKPFLSSNDKTVEETLDYIKCMTLTQNVKDDVYYRLDRETFKQITDYIHDPMTATTIHSTSNKPGGREVITSELIYYWMVAFEIPFECQKWHLNRLLMLIQVCNEKNKPTKKMTKNEIYSRNKALNEARRKRYNSKG